VLTKLHNASVHSQNVCNVTETVTAPLLHLLHSTIDAHRRRVEEVEMANERLRNEIAQLEDAAAT